MTAASKWGGPHSAMVIQKPLMGSYEKEFQEFCRIFRLPCFYFQTLPFLPDLKGVPSKNAANEMTGETKKHATLKKILSKRLLQRWIGVQYHPKTERQSHYGEINMTACYDLVIYCDKTVIMFAWLILAIQFIFHTTRMLWLLLPSTHLLSIGGY